MNYTFKTIENVNAPRSEYLYDGNRTSLYNRVFVRSLYTPPSRTAPNPRANGTRVGQTLRAPGDKKGGRDASQYVTIKKGVSGNNVR